jgi:hypothetical protein
MLACGCTPVSHVDSPGFEIVSTLQQLMTTQCNCSVTRGVSPAPWRGGPKVAVGETHGKAQHRSERTLEGST